MLAPEDLADLGAALRRAGCQISVQQLVAAQQLLLRLAADGALPAALDGLIGMLGPVLCTNAAEQALFASRFREWRADRFGEPRSAGGASEAAAAGLALSQPWRLPQLPRSASALLAVIALVGAAVLLWRYAQPSTPAAPPVAARTAPAPALSSAGAPTAAQPSASAVLQLAMRVDLTDAIAAPSFGDRLQPASLGFAAAPLLLFGLWLLRWVLRRPVLQRLSSRTAPQMREVHVPGAARVLLPSLPLRRLAQELRRRRAVSSDELQLDPTVRATLERGGVFTPVRGSRVEPNYLALIDRASLSDHQALLAAEIVAELARSDVLIDRYDFNRDARVLRPQSADARRPAAAAEPVQAAVELVELRERFAEHRVLVFGDGAGCFDGFSGEPTGWTTMFASWTLPVLLTPVPADRWGRPEWALQRLGIQVLPLDAHGVTLLMSLVAGQSAQTLGAAPLRPCPLPTYERSQRRWLERDAPAAATVDALLVDLRADLQPRGVAWLAACAAYPEVHWGITLRLGAALVPDSADFGRLLPRLAALVWLREAYMPDWFRERLLQELSLADEARVRTTLHAMLEAVARDQHEIPLRIALSPAPDADRRWWARALRRWRASSTSELARDLFRSAAPDSPLRDHVFLRFLSGSSLRRIDLHAPATLLNVLRATPAAQPFAFGVLALLASMAIALVWPPWLFGNAQNWVDDLQFSPDSNRLTLTTRSVLRADGQPLRAGAQTLALDDDAPQWRRSAVTGASAWQAVAPGGKVVVFERGGALLMRAAGASAAGEVVLGSFKEVPLSFFSADGSRIGLVGGDGVQVRDTATGRLIKYIGGLDIGGPYSSGDISSDGTLIAVGNTLGQASLAPVGSGTSRSIGNGTSAVSAMRFSPDGKSIALTRRAKKGSQSVEVYDTASLKTQRILDGLSSIRFSPDGSLIVNWGSSDRLATVFSSTSFTGAVKLENFDAALDIAFSPDGKQLAGIDRQGTLRRWDAATGRQIAEATVGGTCCDARIRYSADGQRVAASFGTEVSVWNLQPRGTTPRGGSTVESAPGAAVASAEPYTFTGDIAWMLCAATLAVLVGPALALLMRCLSPVGKPAALALPLGLTFCLVLLLWWAYGYSLAFTEGNIYVGGLGRAFFNGMVDPVSGKISLTATFSKGLSIPEPVYALFLGVEAALAACLIVAALADRIRLRALLLVVALWLTFAFAPIAHNVWFWMGPDAYTGHDVVDAVNARAGLVWQWGALDFSGGLVVLVNPAVAALVGWLTMRSRRGLPVPVPPQSPGLALVAALLLWVGWLGVTAGSALEAGNSAVLALAGSLWAPAAAALAWSVGEALQRGQPSVIGAALGVLAGLGASMAAAGNVGLVASATLGLVAGVACQRAHAKWSRMSGNEWSSPTPVLGIGGGLGVLAVGVLNAQSLGGPGFVIDWVTAAVGSNSIGSQLWIQFKGLLLVVGWSATVSVVAFQIADRLGGLDPIHLLGTPPLPEPASQPGAASGEMTDSLQSADRGLWLWLIAACVCASIGIGVWALHDGVASLPISVEAPRIADAAANAASTPAGGAVQVDGAASAASAAASAAPAPVASKSNVAAMLVATALVLATVPALCLLCTGLLRGTRPAAVTTAVLTTFAVVTLLWFIYGYSLAFTEGNPLIGGFDRLFFKGVFDPLTGTFAMGATWSKGVYLPELLYAVYEGCLAGLACCLVVAPLASHARFGALLVYTIAWLTFAYAPLTHMLMFWMGPDAYTGTEVVDAMNAKAGLAWAWGVLDVAGGFAVCLGSSVAGLVAAWQLRQPAPRALRDATPWPALAGLALLWLGWYGFAAGGALELGPAANLAAGSNLVGAPAAALGAALVQRLTTGRITARSALFGAWAGLAAVAPAAGSVGIVGAGLLGLGAGGVACWSARGLQSWLGHYDALELLVGLGIGAVVGALGLGALNTTALGGPGLVVDWVTATASSNTVGAQLLIHLKGVLLTIAWSGAVSLVSFKAIDLTIGFRAEPALERARGGPPGSKA